MEHDKSNNISAFDQRFTTNSIQMLKLVIPFFEPSMQQYLCIYIKYMEFQYALSVFKRKPFSPFTANKDMHALFSDLIPYCSPKDKEKFAQFEQIFGSIENMNEMMEMMAMMKEMFQDSDGGFNINNLSELFGSEATGMFDMFQSFSEMNQGMNQEKTYNENNES